RPSRRRMSGPSVQPGRLRPTIRMVAPTAPAPPASTPTVLLHVGTHRSAAGDGERARFRLGAAAGAGARPNRATPVGHGERDRGPGRKRPRAGAADRNVDPGGA